MDWAAILLMLGLEGMILEAGPVVAQLPGLSLVNTFVLVSVGRTYLEQDTRLFLHWVPALHLAVACVVSVEEGYDGIYCCTEI